jgi:hypothetical protein
MTAAPSDPAAPVERSVADPQGLRRQLARIAVEGWDGPAGAAVLGYARSRVVRPQVARAGLRGAAADQAESTGWATAWEVLRAPATAAAASPWGVVTSAVRRAVLGEAVSAAYGTGVRAAWRLHVELAAAPARGRAVSLAELTERGWEPAATPGRRLAGPRVAAIVAAMVAAGWQREQAWQAMDWAIAVADRRFTGHRSGADGASSGWRSLALRSGMAPWRTRRALALLLGEEGWRGLLARVLESGEAVLSDPEVVAAIRSTVRSSHLSPARAAAAARAQGAAAEQLERCAS